MEERIRIPYPVIVEGRYDKQRLEHLIETQILTTDGFGVFNAKEKRMLFSALASKTPLIVLTDSDGAGKLIRSYLSGILPPDRIINLYVPKIPGKEKRKEHPSAEGILGVEGMENDLLRDLFLPYALPDGEKGEDADQPMRSDLTKADLFADGLTGGEGSAARRDALAARLGLPGGMTPNAFLSALRVLCTVSEYRALVEREK